MHSTAPVSLLYNFCYFTDKVFAAFSLRRCLNTTKDAQSITRSPMASIWLDSPIMTSMSKKDNTHSAAHVSPLYSLILLLTKMVETFSSRCLSTTMDAQRMNHNGSIGHYVAHLRWLSAFMHNFYRKETTLFSLNHTFSSLQPSEPYAAVTLG